MADDADDRWTVRGVPKAVRDAAASAADRAKITVGMYLCRAVSREIEAERQPMPMEVLPPRGADIMADNLSDMSDIDVIERAVATAVALAGAPEVPVMFRRRANRALREMLPKPEARVRGPRLLLDAPPDA
jgi:hypothetical protein